MPIVDLNNDYKTKEEFKEDKPFRTQEELKTSILFNKEHSLDTIIRYPKGSKWEIDYFLNIRDVNDALSQPDVNIPPTVQKYNRINKLILYTQSPIQQDTLDNISGEALVNAGFLPNVDDVFISTLTGGREAIFIITEVQNRTYNLHYAYNITFRLFCFIEDNERIYNDLLNKVMKEYVYDKDHLLDYSAPIILQQDYKTKLNLKHSLEEVIDYYFRYFINQDKNIIALKTTSGVYVDTFLIDFVYKILNQTDHLVMSKLNNLDMSILKDKIPYTIWDVIITKNTKLLKLCKTDLGFKYLSSSYRDLVIKRMNILGINYYVGALDGAIELPIPYCNLAITNTLGTEYKIPINKDRLSYVVSKDVYELSNNCIGLLDKLLVDYLENRIINIEELDILIEQYPMWSTREQFYLIPILIVLIKDTINYTFKSL